MYLSYFGLDSQPFSIVPDPRVLYMSQSHREAVAHLLYALNESGGFVQLTGEVGTGKTTVSRYILDNLPEDVDVALLLNPRINEKEMLEVICDELGIRYSKSASQKDLVTKLNEYLLKAHGDGRKTVLIIDEAQNLSREVLEQVRLLTNLETSTDKLLQIILIGQPELAQTLQRHDLRQLSQRIVGRFSLTPLTRQETREYIEHRLQSAGVERPVFNRGSVNLVHELSGGVPRLINVICDRALLGAYGQNRNTVNRQIIREAAKEVLSELPESRWKGFFRVLAWLLFAGILAAAAVGGYFWYQGRQTGNEQVSQSVSPVVDQAEESVVAAEPDRDLSENSEQDHVETPTSEAISDNSGNDAADTRTADVSDPETTTASDMDAKSDNYDLTYRLGVPLTKPEPPEATGEEGG